MSPSLLRPGLRALLLLPVATGLLASAAARGQPRSHREQTQRANPWPDRDESGRDPFRWPDEAPEEARPPGLAGVRILEAVVRGVVFFGTGSGGGPTDEAAVGVPALAVLESSSGEGFVVRPDARLMDGVLDRVRSDGVIFRPSPSRPDRQPGGDGNREIFRPLALPEGVNQGERR